MPIPSENIQSKKEDIIKKIARLRDQLERYEDFSKENNRFISFSNLSRADDILGRAVHEFEVLFKNKDFEVKL